MAHLTRQHEIASRRAPSLPAKVLRNEFLLGCGLLVLIGAVLGRLVNADFNNYDDNIYVTWNAHVQSGLTLANLQWAFTTLDCGNWHPLTWLSLLLDRSLFGARPEGFHATNLVLHIANTLLLFFILRRMTGAMWRSWLVAALFAVHPLHVESVAWIAERKDVLSGLFWMLTMGAYYLFVKKPSFVRYLSIVVLFCLGLMAKPMLVTLPAALLLLDYWPLRRSFSRTLLIEKMPLFFLAIGASAITFHAQSTNGATELLGYIPLQTRLANAVCAYVDYLGQTFWPVNLAVLYGYEYPTWSQGNVLAAAILLLCLTGTAICLRKRRPYLPVGWFWFLGTLVPVIGIIQVGLQAKADRYTYIPLIGLFISIVWAGADLAVNPRLRRPLIALSIGALLACATVAFIQAGVWKSSLTLWQHALLVAKDHASIHQNLAIALAETGKSDEALYHFSKALELNPNLAEHHYNFALAIAKDNPALATQEFSKAVELEPDHLKAYKNLARLWGQAGKQKEAMQALREIIRLEPRDVQAHISLGLTHMKQFEMDEARNHFSEAILLRPQSAQFHNYLGLTYAWQQEFSEAEKHFREALSLNSLFPEALANLAISLAHQGKWKEARFYLERAIKLEPRAVGFHCHLALILGELGEPEAAAKEYQAAARMKPDWPQEASQHAWKLATNAQPNHRNAGDALFLAKEACQATDSKPDSEFLDALAAALAEAGQFDEAVVVAKKALALVPSTAGPEKTAAVRSRLRLYESHQPFRASTN